MQLKRYITAQNTRFDLIETSLEVLSSACGLPEADQFGLPHFPFEPALSFSTTIPPTSARPYLVEALVAPKSVADNS